MRTKNQAIDELIASLTQEEMKPNYGLILQLDFTPGFILPDDMRDPHTLALFRLMMEDKNRFEGNDLVEGVLTEHQGYQLIVDAYYYPPSGAWRGWLFRNIALENGEMTTKEVLYATDNQLDPIDILRALDGLLLEPLELMAYHDVWTTPMYTQEESALRILRHFEQTGDSLHFSPEPVSEKDPYLLLN